MYGAGRSMLRSDVGKSLLPSDQATHQTAIDRDVLRGDVVGVPRAQKCAERAEVFRRAEMAGRDRRRHVLADRALGAVLLTHSRAMFGYGSFTTKDVMLTMRPNRAFFISGSTSCTASTADSMLELMARRQTSMACS